MINRAITLSDGRQFKYHDFSESVVDLKNSKITYLTRSYQEETDSIPTILQCQREFLQWDADLIGYDAAIAHIQVADLTLKGQIAQPVKTFSELQAEKSAEISAACRLQIVSGYKSSALGEEHSYPSNPTDQLNMIASVTDANNPANPPDWATPFWCADLLGLWDYRMHSATQIRQAGADGKAQIIACQQKNAQLQAQIYAATTIAELDAIVW